MKCYKKEEGKLTLVDCSAEDEALCRSFLKKYKVHYRSATEGIYGGTQEVVISEYRHDYVDDDLSCIVENGEVTGCFYKSFCFSLNGQREHDRCSGPSSQGPLIWDRDTWKLMER